MQNENLSKSGSAHNPYNYRVSLTWCTHVYTHDAMNVHTIICCCWIYFIFSSNECTRISALADFRWRIGRFSRKFPIKWGTFFCLTCRLSGAHPVPPPHLSCLSKLFKYVRTNIAHGWISERREAWTVITIGQTSASWTTFSLVHRSLIYWIFKSFV